jgi:nucleoside-diphosphate-sugar epimerase
MTEANLQRKTALVCGAGGFIASHLVKRLKSEGYWVRGVDLKNPDFSASAADEFIIGDLRDQAIVQKVLDRPFDEVYQLAADMGGAGYIFTGEHDADVMHNSAQINLNMAHYGHKAGIKKIFYSSSACMYPAYNQEDPSNPKCSEDSAYPAAPDSEYGWEKLFSERLYLSYYRNYGLNPRDGTDHAADVRHRRHKDRLEQPVREHAPDGVQQAVLIFAKQRVQVVHGRRALGRLDDAR